jgi:hypothetical protein
MMNISLCEHFLVIAHVAVVGIPGGQAHVEAGILGDDVLVDRPDLRELPVRRRQKRVKERQTQVLFGVLLTGCHGGAPEKMRCLQVSEAATASRVGHVDDLPITRQPQRTWWRRL